MPERFEIICIVYKRRYINTLPFLYYKSTYLLFFLGTNGVGHCCTLLAVTTLTFHMRFCMYVLLLIDVIKNNHLEI